MAKIKITLSKKKLAVGIALASLIFAGSIVALMKFGLLNNTKQEVPVTTSEEMQIKASEYFDSGDVEGGLGYYDEQIGLSKDGADKQSLLVQKSGFALMAGRADVGIDAAMQANEIGSNPETLRVLAEAYAAKGDKAQAIIYYKKLSEMLPPDKGNDGGISRGPSVEEIIKGLQQ